MYLCCEKYPVNLVIFLGLACDSYVMGMGISYVMSLNAFTVIFQNSPCLQLHYNMATI